jgi:hypothetical protein
MRGIVRVLSGACAALLLALPAAAALPEAPPTGLSDAWAQVRAAASADPAGPAFGSAVDALVAARDAEGLDSLETAGAALADWAEGAVEQGRSGAAERLSRAAVRVAPGAPEGYLVRARMYWSDGNPLAAAGWTARAAGVGLAHAWVGLAWVGYAAIVFWIAAATAFAVLLAPSLAQGVRTFHHLAHEYAGFRIPSFLVMAGAVAVLALPIAGRWGVGWTVLLWTLVAWAGDAERDRRAQVLLLMVALMGPWLCAPFLAPSRPPSEPVEFALLEGRGALPAATESAPQVLPADDADWRVAFALGNAALRNGANDEAIAWYEQARAGGGDDERLTHNIATAHFRAGRFTQAERLFAKLAQDKRASARTLYNLGQAQSRRLDFDAARVSFNRAREADADVYLRVSNGGDEREDFHVVPFAMSNADARSMLLRNAGAWGEFAGPLWGVLFAGVPPWAAPLLMLGAGLMAWLLPRMLKGHRVHACDVCRGSVCPDCMRFVHDLHVCRACARSFGETRGTAADIHMMRDRRRHLGVPAWRVAERLVPGLLDLRRGRYARASMQVMFLSFVVWWAALLSTIPAWAVAVPVYGWPIIRLFVVAVVLAQVGWTWYAAAHADAEAARK